MLIFDYIFVKSTYEINKDKIDCHIRLYQTILHLTVSYHIMPHHVLSYRLTSIYLILFNFLSHFISI